MLPTGVGADLCVRPGPKCEIGADLLVIPGQPPGPGRTHRSAPTPFAAVQASSRSGDARLTSKLFIQGETFVKRHNVAHRREIVPKRYSLCIRSLRDIDAKRSAVISEGTPHRQIASPGTAQRLLVFAMVLVLAHRQATTLGEPHDRRRQLDMQSKRLI